MLITSPKMGLADGKPSQIPITPNTTAKEVKPVGAGMDAVSHQGGRSDAPPNPDPVHRDQLVARKPDDARDQDQHKVRDRLRPKNRRIDS
jgi:hypothetical protein